MTRLVKIALMAAGALAAVYLSIALANVPAPERGTEIECSQQLRRCYFK